MQNILVAGATGNVGSRVVQELRGRGAPVRAFVRDAGMAAAKLGDDVELAVGGFDDFGSIRAALDGVDGLFLACSNQPRQVEYETRVIDLAREAGVRRIVKLSAQGAEVGSPVAFWDWHGRIEEHLLASEVPSTILRPAFFMTNLLGSAEVIGQTGMMLLPAGGASVAMIDPTDVAVVAAVALTGEGRDREVYTLTGPEAITFERVAEGLSAATGRHVQFVSVPDEAARQSMIEGGLPDFVADQIVAVFGFLRRGMQEHTSATVRVLTGNEPHDIAGFARDHARLFGKEAAPAAL